MTSETDKWFKRWAFITTACFTLSFCAGPFTVLPVFVTTFEADFGWSRTVTSSVYSTFLFTAAVSNVVIGRLTDRYGLKFILIACSLLMGLGLALISQIQNIWQFYIVYVLATLGVGAIFVVPPSTIQRSSLRRPALALGITMAGISASRVVFVPIAGFLLLALDWRLSYLILGVIIWLLVSISAILLLTKHDRGLAEPDNTHRQEMLVNEANTDSDPTTGGKGLGSLKELIQNRVFILTLVLYVLPIACNQMIILHLIPFAEGVGISTAAAATATGLGSAFGVVGTIVCPALSGIISWRRLVFITAVICSLAMVWLMSTGSLWMLYLFVAFYSFFFYGHITTRIGFTKLLFGAQSLASLLGMLLGAGALVSTLTPLAAGYLYDKTGSYSISFLTAAILFAITAFIALLLKKPSRSQPSFAL
ncbi:MFS transporter [Chloroflexota bacterium]